MTGRNGLPFPTQQSRDTATQQNIGKVEQLITVAVIKHTNDIHAKNYWIDNWTILS